MSKRALITGGAGFIGSHLADELLAAGWRVRALDALVEQVHGPLEERPVYLDPEVELVVGDVRDAGVVRGALEGVDAVAHLAARVGVGQSMYEIAPYVGANDYGTAVLLEELERRPVEHLLVASSMSLYGEGLYRTRAGALRGDVRRERPAAVRNGGRTWDPLDPDTGLPLDPVPTPETKPPDLSSVYALSKYVQERLCLLVAEARGTAVTALRFFNVYGPRQALSNPYTGVLAIFAARILNGNRPVVFEDGGQRRDFVHVSDVARACRLALESPAAGGRVLNVGSGESRTVAEVARAVAAALGREDLAPEITQRFRAGDVRHCFADVSAAAEALGFRPHVAFEDGLEDLVGWLEEQEAVDRFESARAELEVRGLAS